MSYRHLGQIRPTPIGYNPASDNLRTGLLIGGGLVLVFGLLYAEHRMRESVRRSAGAEGLAAYDTARIVRSLVMNRQPTRRRR